IQNWQQDEAENPELDQDFRLALAYKRIAKDLVAVQQTEARMERSLDRALTAFHRLRKFRPPDAQPIEPPLTGVTTTGRDPASYFFVDCEPKPTPAENPQTPPVQALAAEPPNLATDSEPKPKPKRCTGRKPINALAVPKNLNLFTYFEQKPLQLFPCRTHC